MCTALAKAVEWLPEPAEAAPRPLSRKLLVAKAVLRLAEPAEVAAWPLSREG